MAEASVCITQDQFSCSICLDVLRDPATLPCGHSYCMGCIKTHWDQDDQTGVYSCPQCRETFTPRPVLGRNTLLAEVVEKLKETGLSGPPPAPSPAGPGDVLCDVCTGRQVRAVKSCLVCLASYCQTHLQPHCEAAPLKRHQLVEATGQLDKKLCSRHGKLLEVYCRADRTCVCLMCTVDDHRGHNIVPAAAERTERQKQLGATQRQTQQRLQEREKELQELRQAVDSLRSSAQRAVEDSDRIFSELDRSVKRMRHAVAQLIQVNQQAVEIRGAALLERLEQEIAELRRRDAELSQISHTEDHIHFLQSYKSFCGRPAGGDVPNISVNPDFSFGEVKKSVLKLKRQLEDIWKEESVKISRTVNEAAVYKLKALQPRTRAEFLHYACQLTLDPNTAHRHLRLSEGNRRVTWVRQERSPVDLPQRFDCWGQVLCREGLSGGRFYWEVEWSRGVAAVGVAYAGLARKGREAACALGNNALSWRLSCSGAGCAACHSRSTTAIAAPPGPRVGVFLDHAAGRLSFYSVSGDELTLLHSFQAAFTEPLYPGFGVYGYWGTTVALCQLELPPPL